MNHISFLAVLLLVLAFQATLISAQSLPQCVIDAFPDLNITEVAQYRPDEKSGGLVCDLCTALFTEIQHILLDGEIEDAVSNNPRKFGHILKLHWFQIAHAVENLCIPIIWAFEPCWKIVESCLPDMIQAFVDFAGPPEEYCYLLFLCPDRPTTPGIEY